MKVVTKHYDKVEEYDTLEYYAECKLDGDGFESGVIEATAETARNNSKAIGRLLDLLASKGLVSASEAGGVIDPYLVGSIRFEK